MRSLDKRSRMSAMRNEFSLIVFSKELKERALVIVQSACVQMKKPQMRAVCAIGKSTLLTQKHNSSNLAPIGRMNKYLIKNNKTKRILILAFLLMAFSCLLTINNLMVPVAEATVLMRVCDTREIKTVTNRVCMLYKRTKNSDVKLDRQGNLRMTRDTKGEYSPAKLASDCCKIGCPPHIFAYNCD